MATTPTYPTVTGPVQVAKRVMPADSTNIVDVYDNSAGTSAVKFDSLTITTDNSADRIVTFYIYSGTTSFRLGSCSVPDLSGTNGTTDPRINVLSTLGVAGPDGVLCVWVSAGNKLQVGLDAALASNKVLDVIGRAWTFL